MKRHEKSKHLWETVSLIWVSWVASVSLVLQLPLPFVMSWESLTDEVCERLFSLDGCYLSFQWNHVGCDTLWDTQSKATDSTAIDLTCNKSFLPKHVLRLETRPNVLRESREKRRWFHSLQRIKQRIKEERSLIEQIGCVCPCALKIHTFILCRNIDQSNRKECHFPSSLYFSTSSVML
jgi:hypothetical protein